jgi:hypothetical protein
MLKQCRTVQTRKNRKNYVDFQLRQKVLAEDFKPKIFLLVQFRSYAIIIFRPSTFKPTRPLVKIRVSYVEHSLLVSKTPCGHPAKNPFLPTSFQQFREVFVRMCVVACLMRKFGTITFATSFVTLTFVTKNSCFLSRRTLDFQIYGFCIYIRDKSCSFMMA